MASTLPAVSGSPQENGNSSVTNATFSAGCAVNKAEGNFDQISFVIAICLAILAAVSNNLGVNFQKLAWTKKQSGKTTKAKYRFIWICGMIGIILASVFDFVALAFGPQSVIAPLGSLTMVMNACVAPWMHGERLPRIVFLATFIIVAGCATAVASASHENIICDLSGIFAFFLTVQTIIYFIFVTFMVVGIVLATRKFERILQEFKTDSDEYQKVYKYHRVSYALVAGLMGAQSVVFARSIGMMFQSTARTGELFLARGETYGILIGLIGSIYFQLLYLNKGLERFESSYNVPVFTGTFIVSTAVAGGIVYGEFNAFQPYQAALFPLGVLACIFGVSLLARGGSASAPAVPHDESSDEESGVRSPNNVPKSMKGMDMSLVSMQDIKSMESDGGDQFPEKPQSLSMMKSSIDLPHANGTLPKAATLRIRSGGFIPFVIEENSHRRSTASSVGSLTTMGRNRAATAPGAQMTSRDAPAMSAGSQHTLKPNWLLGFRIDEEEDYVREGSTPSY